MNVRGYLSVVGAAAVLAGVAVLVEPGLASLVGLRTDRVVVTVLASLALLQGGIAVSARLVGGGRAAEPGAVERRFRAPVPGDDFDDRLTDLPDLRVRRRDEERAAIRERLENVAVDVLVARGLDEDGARRHLRSGTWTADERAASFFVPAADRELSFGARLRDAFGSDLAFTRRARRAVAAIAAHAEREVPPPGVGTHEADTGRDAADPPESVDSAAADGGVERE
jgi:hypothetical protein